MKYKIGIISDTHNVLREEVITELKSCDYILHAGDFVSEDIYKQLQSLGKMIAVKGNNDQLDLEGSVFFKIGGYIFYMTHILGERKDVDFYIYGHSHKYASYQENKTHYLNPGSCGRKRFSLPLTYMILYIDDNGYKVERRDCE